MGHLSTTTTCGIVLALFSAGLLITGGETVRIKKVIVPKVVLNGSDSVILDCDYSVDTNQAGLVVKWFFNNDPQPVYQWIPSRKPQELGVLKGKLNLEYRASDDENAKYRALQIILPTTELSGEYKCFVSTYDDEDSATRKMVIYVPEKKLELKQMKPKEDRVTVSCIAEGVYPEPNITLRSYPPSLLERVPGLTQETKNTAEGLFDISATVTVEDREFQSDTKFECELKIPEANYTATRSFVYIRGPPSTTVTPTELPSTESTSNESFLATGDINGSSKNHHQWVFTVILLLFTVLRL